MANLNILPGFRSFSNSAWKDLEVENQTPLGIDYDITKKSWPVSILIGMSGSSASSEVISGSETADVEVTTQEFDIGARKYFIFSGFRPYVSTGLAVIQLTQTGTCEGCTGSVKESDTATGVFVNLGLMWHFRNGFNFGLDARILTGADMKNDVDANYSQFVLILGFGI